MTLANGTKVEGPLVRADDFTVTLRMDDDSHRTFTRSMGIKVEIHNPQQAHLDMLTTWNDKDIHNLTAYLVTVK